jgi:hypothetical protein
MVTVLFWMRPGWSDGIAFQKIWSPLPLVQRADDDAALDGVAEGVGVLPQRRFRSTNQCALRCWSG